MIRTTVALLAFYLLALLFNGEALYREAERLPYGEHRDFCVALAKPLATISQITRLGWPRAWLEKRIDKELE